MAWVKLDDSVWSHPKLIGLTDTAHTLWVRTLCWSAEHLTDGLLPDSVRNLIGQFTDSTAKELVDAGLWEETTNGYEIVNYLKWNPSAQKVKDNRARDRLRKAKGNETQQKRSQQFQKDSERNPRGTKSDSDRPVPVPVPNISTATDADAFDAFWDNYPKKVSKDQARKAYEKRIKQGISPSLLASKALEYATLMEHEQRDKKFIKNPATWLNAAAYEDDMAIPQEKISHEQWKMNNLPKVDLNEWL